MPGAPVVEGGRAASFTVRLTRDGQWRRHERQLHFAVVSRQRRFKSTPLFLQRSYF